MVTIVIRCIIKIMRIECISESLTIMNPKNRSTILAVGRLPETWLEYAYTNPIFSFNPNSPQHYRMARGILKRNAYV